MDELDSVIVAVLQSDGRRSNRDLAQMLGVAPSTTLERVRALRARGRQYEVHDALVALTVSERRYRTRSLVACNNSSATRTARVLNS